MADIVLVMEALLGIVFLTVYNGLILIADIIYYIRVKIANKIHFTNVKKSPQTR